MPIRDQALRRRYVRAANELRANSMPVTPRNLATYLQKRPDAVGKFLRCDRSFAKEIKAQIQSLNSGSKYLAALDTLTAKGVKVTHRALAEALGIERCSVSHYLADNPEIREVVWRVSGRDLRPDVQAANPNETEVPETEAYVETSSTLTWEVEVRKTRELTVQYLDVQLQRIVLDKVSPAEYIRLWDKKHLKFQIEELPKPDFLPTREQMQAFL